jgi:hypothetical protein
MPYLPPAHRALDVVAPVVVYRAIGRRPSRVFVDEAMNATNAKKGQHRLKDRVYWRTRAEPGDQIQDRPGGTLLLKASGECHPVLLAEPQPLAPATAFTHAELAIKADHAVVEKLIADGKLAEATPRRPKGLPSRPSDRVLGEDHPLVIDELPADFSLKEEDVRPRAGARWTRSR